MTRPLALLGALVAVPLLLLARAGADGKASPAGAGGVGFSHEAHVARGVAIDACASCHLLAADGRAAPPTSANPHQPCATSGCHEAEFFSRTPTVCVVCHDDTSPSRKQVARYSTRRPGGRSEFGGEISHVSHARPVAGQGPNSGCTACHGDPYRKTPPPEGHAVCAGCHGATARPAMATCGGCHKRGALGAAARPQASAWAVAASFQHPTHGADPRAAGQDTLCVTCHAGVPTAAHTNQIVAPKMESCDGCHDGRKAFKTTGFECKKCHAAGH